MATMKIKKDDMVQVIAGKDKGKEGKVLSVDAKNNKVLVEGVNIVHKHSKPSMQNKGKPVRVGFQGEKKDKVRVAKIDGKTEVID